MVRRSTLTYLAPSRRTSARPFPGLRENFCNLAGDLNICSKRGLSERFDSTIGAGTVLMPFGGKYQLTPIQAMIQKISMERKHTDDCSFMAWGYNPLSRKKPLSRGLSGGH